MRTVRSAPTMVGGMLAMALLSAIAPEAAAQGRGPRLRGSPVILDTPVPRSVSLDLGAALDERWRLQLEPIVLGRVTIGVSGQWTTAPDRDQSGGVVTPLALALPPDGDAPCTSEICTTGWPGYDPGEQRVRYRAAAASLHVRWYPELLSVGDEGRSAQLYIGEYIGYHRRRITTTSWYGWGGVEPPIGGPGVPEPGRPDSAVAPPVIPPVLPPYPTQSRWTQHLRGWEPGIELGVRGQLGPRLLMDLGFSTRLVTIDDPLSARRPGQTDTRLVVGVGFGW
jgi:hypothetical protein